MTGQQISQFPTQSAWDLVPITPHDSNNITDGGGKEFTARGFYVGATAGNVVITTRDGYDRTIPVLANSYHWVQFTKVKSTGTTAATIFAAK